MRTIIRAVIAACAALLALAATPALAQDYQPGQAIEYKAETWPAEKWEQGVFVREAPGGTQVIIREKPTQFFPEGSQRAYNNADVRPLRQAAAPAAQPRAQPAPALVRAPAPAPRTVAAGGGGGCTGAPMSQAQVLGFLQARIQGDPFANNPLREATLAALREEVLKCGVSFHNHAIGDFANELGKYGALSNVTAALSDNFGPPAKRAELFGTWRIAKVGATTTVTRNGDAYQRQEYAGLAGSLTINANGTYVWDSPSGVFRGSWRAATRAEMDKSDKGGEGVVLLDAKSGVDWLVHKRTEEGQEGTGIMIRDLATRNLRERATR